MAVRKIPQNDLVASGFASRKNAEMDGVKPSLEKEYMLLLDSDERAERFDPTYHDPSSWRGEGREVH